MFSREDIALVVAVAGEEYILNCGKAMNEAFIEALGKKTNSGFTEDDMIRYYATLFLRQAEKTIEFAQDLLSRFFPLIPQEPSVDDSE